MARRGAARLTLRLAIGLAVAAATLWLTYRRTDLEALGRALAQSDWPWLAAVLPLLALSYVLRIVRWRILLSPVGRVSFRVASGPLLSGFMINSLLPGRVGEVARALLLSRKTGISRASSMATVVLARLFDGLTLTAFTLLVLLSSWDSFSPGVRLGLAGAGVMYLAVLGVLVALRMWHERAAAVVARPFGAISSGLAERVESILISFSEGLEVLRSAREVVQVTLLSGGVWLSLALSTVPALLSLRMEVAPLLPFLILVLAAFGMLIPTPAGTGTVHYAVGVLLPAIAGVADTRAKLLAIVFHASQFLPIIAAGLVAAAMEGLGAGEIGRYAEEPEPRETLTDPPN